MKQRQIEGALSRRELLKQSAAGLAGLTVPLWLPLGLTLAKPFKMAVIADLHHGLAPDALPRFQAFVDEVH